MNISENDGTYTAYHVTGPTHNMLSLKISRGAPQKFVVTVLPPIGECSHRGGQTVEEIALEIEASLENANTALKTDYMVEAAAIFENDTRQRGIYAYLTQRIVEKAAASQGS